MSSYYKKINGKNFDRAMLDVADKSIDGRGDGRVSLTDAKAIFKKAKDGGKITDIELRTLNYILENYKFTEPALKYIEVSLADNLVLKDRESLNTEKQEFAQKETPKENKPMPLNTPQKNEKKSSKLKYFIIFIILLLLLLAFLLINFLCKKGILSTDKDNNEIVPALASETLVNTSNDEDAKKALAEEAARKALDDEKAKKAAADAESSKNTIQNEKNGYVVKQYDSLVKISQDVYGNYKYWEDIYKANRDKIKNPILIYPGQVLTIPEKKK